MRSEGYCSWVCVSVKSHLTSGTSVHPENTVTCSAGSGGPKICGVFSVAEIQHFSIESIRMVGHFPAESAHAHYQKKL